MNGARSIIKHMIPSSIIRHRLDVANCILFTFDDGPHPEITPRVLDLLDEYDARGLFFIPANRINKAPELLNEIVTRNHGIGNHSSTHTPCSELSFQEIQKEIDCCKDEICVCCNYVTDLYRPPRGITNLPLLIAAWRSKHKIIRWSIDSGEYSYMRKAGSHEIAKNFMKKIHDRAIILSHDDIETTPEYLKIVLPKMLAEGYDLKGGLQSLMPDS